MIFLVAAGIGLLLGYAFGGRVANLPSLRLKGLWLMVAALVLQLLIFPLFSDRPMLPYATGSLHIASYVLVFAFLTWNLDVRPLFAVGAGALFNFVVIAANGGRMPASATALERAGLVASSEQLIAEGTHGNVLLMSDTTRINFFGDCLYLPKWIPFATAFSLGDVLIMIGLAWLIVRGMRSNA